MNKDIVWKEARSNREDESWDDSEEEEEEQDKDHSDHNDECLDDSETDTRNQQTSEIQPDCNDAARSSSISSPFSHRRIDLKLRRNIVALAEAAKQQQQQQKSKPNYPTNNEQFSAWLENALVAISPNADFILFAAQSPEKVAFFAKLRMEPIDQYCTKELDIPLDFDEHITSLLCLPIMSTQRTSLGSVDWTALVIGLSSGYVKFYTEKSVCLLSLKFCDEPILSIKCQSQKNTPNGRSQTHFASMVDELLVTYRTNAIVIDGIGLYENLRISKEDIVKNGAHYEPAYTFDNLPTILTCQRWKLSEFSRDSKTSDADLFGMRCTTRFDLLRSDSMNLDNHKPTKSCTRTLATVGRNPFLCCYQEAKETTNHSYTEIISSLLPFWSKPQPTRMQVNEVANSSSTCLFDKGRLATTIISSPDKRLALVTDDFGRVMLVDVTNWLVVRLWKGYRSAQCGWIEVKRNPEERGSPCASFVAIYAPKRGLLEIWSAQRGPRVAAFNVGRGCRLLYSGFKMFNMRAEAAHLKGAAAAANTNLLIDQSYSTHCYLLNPKTGTVYTIELPYTYSLYKYGDLRSRDHLLLGELTGAIQQDSEVKLISEIIHRIVLAESLQISIQKVAFNLNPDKIVPIMENLVNKTMKNYDNDSGETMTDEDSSIVEVCKRLIRLCSMYKDLSKSSSGSLDSLALPDVNRRLIDEYEEHPQEVDEFADQLGWTPGEVLRYLSLLALERSYRKNHIQDPWPNMGEPLTWLEFVSCFELSPENENRRRKSTTSSSTSAQLGPKHDERKLLIKLKACDSKFLNQDKVIKTALFLYNKLSENFYKSSSKSTKIKSANDGSLNSFTYLEPSSRLALLVQFWLSTKLCNHWKMWAFLQDQVGRVSDELKVVAMAQDDDDDQDDSVLIEIWRQIYQLILESDNIYAAMIATATIKSDTIRTIEDNERRNKLKKQEQSLDEEEQKDKGEQQMSSSSNIDWECLCIDAERMSIVSQQLEDVFLLNLLLRYSVREGHLTSSAFVYKLPRISVANILRSGPTIVTELVAQWAVQSGVDLAVFTRSYGDNSNAELPDQLATMTMRSTRSFASARSNKLNNQEHAEELLHHTRTSYPFSLEPSVVLLNCVWEFCRRWTSSGTSASDKANLLNGAYEALTKLDSVILRHNLASVAYKTFFQRTFERLTLLVETNVAFLGSNTKSSQRTRDTLTRKELNMGEECLENFIEFCCHLSEFMLQTCKDATTTGDTHDEQTTSDSAGSALAEQRAHLLAKLSTLDDWWSMPGVVKILNDQRQQQQVPVIRRISTSSGSVVSDIIQPTDEQQQNNFSLVRASLSFDNLMHVDTLVELNRLANLMNLIFKLKITKAYPLSLIGEESRQILKFDLQQSPTTGLEMKTRSGSLNELRQKFARKCIVNIVVKLTEEKNEITEDEYAFELFTCTGAGGSTKAKEERRSDGRRNEETDEDIDTKESDKKQLLSQRDLFVHTASGSSKQTSLNQSKHRQQRRQQQHQTNDKSKTATSSSSPSSSSTFNRRNMTDQGNNIDSSDVVDDGNGTNDDDGHGPSEWRKDENNELLVLFASLLSLANEWRLHCDELHLEFVFELYRCNHDKIAQQMATRIQDTQTLAKGLLKICSQRVLVMFGLSPQISHVSHWKRRIDKWSMFQPNVASWLKSIQQEEMRRELASLSFSTLLKPTNFDANDNDDDDHQHDDDDDDESKHGRFISSMEQSLGVQLFVLNAIGLRTRPVLESVTNYLDGQAARLAYDLLQVLDFGLFDKFLSQERKLWLKQRGRGKGDGGGANADAEPTS